MLKRLRRGYVGLMDFPGAKSTRAEKQQKHVQYDAKGFTEKIYTRLDAFGRVSSRVIDGVDGGGLMVEEMLSGEEEMWSANGSEKRGSNLSKWNFPMMN